MEIEERTVRETLGFRFVKNSYGGELDHDTRVFSQNDDLLCWISGDSIDDFLQMQDKEGIESAIEEYRI